MQKSSMSREHCNNLQVSSESWDSLLFLMASCPGGVISSEHCFKVSLSSIVCYIDQYSAGAHFKWKYSKSQFLHFCCTSQFEFFSFLNYIFLKILFLTALGLTRFTWAFSAVASGGYSSVAVHELLIAIYGFSCCRVQASFSSQGLWALESQILF